MDIKTCYQALNSPEAESMLLASLMIKPDKIVNLESNEDDLYYEVHKIIFSEMSRQYADKQKFDLVSLLSALKGKEANGHNLDDYLMDLRDMPSFNTESYDENIKELSRKRRIWEYTEHVTRNIHEMSSCQALQELSELSKSTIKADIYDHSEIVEKIIEGLEMPKQCYPTGIEKLDEVMKGGLYEGFTYGFCGAEKAGKTTLAHSISYNLTCPHLYVAMEMGAAQIEQRNIARDLGTNSLAFLDRAQGLNRNSIETRTRKRPVFYLDSPGATLNEVILNITQSMMKNEIKGFIIDYWQLVQGQQRGESEEKHLRNVAQSLADFARKNKLWCILMAQMNQDGRLFGGNGLRKACDQLYMIQEHDEEFFQNGRWLKMDASRYTTIKNVGGEKENGLIMQTKQGPYFE